MINVMDCRVLACVAMAALCSGALSQEKDARPALERYQGAQEFGAMMCSLTFKSSQTMAEGAALGIQYDAEKLKKADYRACIATQKLELKAAYESATRTVKKSAARNALKEHYISAVARLEGIAPTSSERQFQYEQRQSANESKVKENWTRFEVEN